MRNALRLLCVGFVAACLSFALPKDASAQYPVAVQPVVPAVVGYAAERRGLFGRRIVYRPVVAPAAAVVPVAPTVAVARPVVTAARVEVGYAPAAPAVTSYYAPAAPVTSYYAPAAPVTSYYAPAAPVTSYYAPAAPITTYRVPVPAPAYVPLIGF